MPWVKMWFSKWFKETSGVSNIIGYEPWGERRKKTSKKTANQEDVIIKGEEKKQGQLRMEDRTLD